MPNLIADDKGSAERIRCGLLEEEIRSGREVVSTSFVIPYPPGFPILVTGPVISAEIPAA